MVWDFPVVAGHRWEKNTMPRNRCLDSRKVSSQGPKDKLASLTQEGDARDFEYDLALPSSSVHRLTEDRIGSGTSLQHVALENP